MTLPDDNGILAQVPGEEISAGSKSLPPPAAGQPEYMTADIDTARLGRIRIVYQLMSYKRRKNVYWFWCAKHAALLLPGQ